MARDRRLAALLLAGALGTGCRRGPETPRSAGGDAKLEAPAPAGLLSAASTGYDNAQQARYLQEEAKRMGISSLDKPSGETGASEEAPRDPVTYAEGIERTRTLITQFAAQRRAVDKGRPKPVGLEGATPLLIPGKPRGGPLEDAPQTVIIGTWPFHGDPQ